MFIEIDQQHEVAKKQNEEHNAIVNENIKMKKEALEREESEKVK